MDSKERITDGILRQYVESAISKLCGPETMWSRIMEQIVFVVSQIVKEILQLKMDSHRGKNRNYSRKARLRIHKQSADISIPCVVVSYLAADAEVGFADNGPITRRCSNASLKRGQGCFRLEAFQPSIAPERVSRDKWIPSSLGPRDCFKITRSQFWNFQKYLCTRVTDVTGANQ